MEDLSDYLKAMNKKHNKKMIKMAIVYAVIILCFWILAEIMRYKLNG